MAEDAHYSPHLSYQMTINHHISDKEKSLVHSHYFAIELKYVSILHFCCHLWIHRGILLIIFLVLKVTRNRCYKAGDILNDGVFVQSSSFSPKYCPSKKIWVVCSRLRNKNKPCLTLEPDQCLYFLNVMNVLSRI